MVRFSWPASFFASLSISEGNVMERFWTVLMYIMILNVTKMIREV
jgi:hypothetical protein